MSCCYSLLPFKRQFKYHHLYKASSQLCCFPSAFPWYHINDSNASICIFISNFFTGILISISLQLWRLALVMLHFYCTDVIYEETGEMIEWMSWLLIIWSPCSHKNKCFSSHVLMVAKHFSTLYQNPTESFFPPRRETIVCKLSQCLWILNQKGKEESRTFGGRKWQCNMIELCYHMLILKWWKTVWENHNQ